MSMRQLISRAWQEWVTSIQKLEVPSSEHPTPASLLTFSTFAFDVVLVNLQGHEIQRRRGAALSFTEVIDHGVGLELMLIPGNDLQIERQRPAGQPQRPIVIKPFLIGKYPVMQMQWRLVAGLPKISRDLQPEPAQFKGDHRPVERISWDDAIEFCARLSCWTQHPYRLPSEAEWEYACRAGTLTPFHFGATITTALANYDGNHTYALACRGQNRQETTPVGTFRPNAYGLYDMHGNVWEWCSDHWYQTAQKTLSDGYPWISGNGSSPRLLRGGSWRSHPCRCSSDYRFWLEPHHRFSTFGFRVVCTAI